MSMTDEYLDGTDGPIKGKPIAALPQQEEPATIECKWCGKEIYRSKACDGEWAHVGGFLECSIPRIHHAAPIAPLLGQDEPKELPPLDYDREALFEEGAAKGIKLAWLIDQANQMSLSCRERQLTQALTSLAEARAEIERLKR